MFDCECQQQQILSVSVCECMCVCICVCALTAWQVVVTLPRERGEEMGVKG